MNWQTLRELHPDQWVLVEAMNATSQNGWRCMDELALIQVLGADSTHIWQVYRTYREAMPQREIYFLHTANTEIKIKELDPFTHLFLSRPKVRHELAKA